MAYSLLFGERPLAPATSTKSGPLHMLFGWYANARERRVQRLALSALLELDAAMLEDLGIEREDIIEALHQPHRAGARLASRRAQRADHWLSHP